MIDEYDDPWATPISKPSKIKEDKTVEEKETVNHPDHYTDCSLECIDVMVLIFGVEKTSWWCVQTAFKYVWRWRFKNGYEDLEKASWYLNWIRSKRTAGYSFPKDLTDMVTCVTDTVAKAKKEYKQK